MTTAAVPRTHRQKEIRRHLLLYAGVTPFLLIAVFPIFWMAVTAFKQEPDLYRMGNIPFWFNLPPTLKNFETLFYQTNYGYWIVNTLTISAWVALITLLTAVPAGYALARLKLPGAENIGIAIFMTYLVPGIILFLPLSRVVASLGLQDSWWALVVVYPTFTIPFCTWLMMGFFKTVPMEMEEAARVDGCGQLSALVRVVLPVSLPGVLTSVIFAFTLSMQDFLYGLAFVAPGDQKPVPVGVPTELIRGDVFFWGSIMAAALLVGLGGAGDGPASRSNVRLFVLGRFLNRIGATGVAEMNHQVLDGLRRAVHVVVPPPTVVHEGLSRGVVLNPLGTHRTGIVVGDEHAIEDEDVRRHAELLPAGLAARLDLHDSPRDEDRRDHGGGETAKRGDEAGDLGPLRLRGLCVLGFRGKAREADNEQGGCGSDGNLHDHRHAPREKV